MEQRRSANSDSVTGNRDSPCIEGREDGGHETGGMGRREGVGGDLFKEKDSDCGDNCMAYVPVDASDINPNMYLPIPRE